MKSCSDKKKCSPFQLLGCHIGKGDKRVSKLVFSTRSTSAVISRQKRETNEKSKKSGVRQSDRNLRIVIENTNCNAWFG